MLLLGTKPGDRNTEQHDVFFGIGVELKDLIPEILSFWPEAGSKIHVDAWREVNKVNEYAVEIVMREEEKHSSKQEARLFFINLGGYKENEFEEFHYKMIVAGTDKGEAIRQAKETAFYRHTGFKGADSHVDDKYGVDVDDLYEIADILSENAKQQYRIVLTPAKDLLEDKVHLGYFTMARIQM